MTDNTHAAMCVYCGEAVIYDTREVTDMAAAHYQIMDHDQQCPRNPLVARIAFLNQQNTVQQEQNDALSADRAELIKELIACQNMLHGLARSGGCSPDYPNDAKAVLERATGGHAPFFEDNGPTGKTLERRDALNQSEGMRKAARIIEHKANAYDEEYGSTDPSTGTREYPGNGDEYYNELMELADDLRQQAEGHQ
ncbi:hypothetical protein [Vreelandella sp. EE22]